MKFKFEDGVFEIEPKNWREANLKLDSNGMEVVQTDYEFDHKDDKSVQKYFNKVARDIWPEDLHWCLAKMLRRPESEPNGIKTTRYVHSDVSSTYELDMSEGSLASQVFPNFKKGDWFRITGFWINCGPKHTGAPLILSDLETVDLKVYETAAKRIPPLNPYQESLFPNYDEKIDWYAFDDLEPNEILLIKHHNRYDAKAHAFHSGPVDPDKSKPQRVSCDSRVLTIKKTKNSS